MSEVDPTNTILLISTILSVTTSLVSVYYSSRAVYQASIGFPQKLELLDAEVGAMRDIIEECYLTIEEGPMNAPPHAKDLFFATYEQLKDVAKLFEKSAEMVMKSRQGPLSRISTIHGMHVTDKEISSAVAVLRDKVGLLRDACSEIRVRAQLIEISAAMARLTEIALSSMESPASATAPVAESDPSDPSTQVAVQQHRQQIIRVMQDLFRRDITSWQADDYLIDGAVQIDCSRPDDPGEADSGRIILQDPSRQGGQQFDLQPARIKMDTGSVADFTTLEYLERVGFNLDTLQAIPQAEQTPFEGLNKRQYTPKFRVNLRWYRFGEGQVNETPFLVVDQAPYDIILSSRRFAEEAERRLMPPALPLTLSRPTPEQIEAARKRREQAKQMEEEARRAALALRNLTPGHASTVYSQQSQQQQHQGAAMHKTGDIELGIAANEQPTATASGSRRAGGSWRGALFWRKR